MAKETPTNRLLPVRRNPGRPWPPPAPPKAGKLWHRSRWANFGQGGFGGDLKWLRDLTEGKPESRDLTAMPLFLMTDHPERRGL